MVLGSVEKSKISEAHKPALLVKYQCPSDSQLYIFLKFQISSLFVSDSLTSLFGLGSEPNKDLVLEKEEFEAAVFQLCSDNKQVCSFNFMFSAPSCGVHEEQTCSTCSEAEPGPHVGS